MKYCAPQRRERYDDMTHDDPANQVHDDAASTEGHTMAKYFAWHKKNCNCEPAAHDDAAQDNTHTDDAAEARREEDQENEK